MDAKNKLELLLQYTGENRTSLGKRIGQVPQTFHDIHNEKIKSFSPNVVKKIKAIFPEINEDFFLFDSQNLLIGTEKRHDNNSSKNDGNSKVVNIEELNPVKAFIIPIKGKAGLQSNYYADVMINDLEVEEGGILTNEKKFGTYFKIEVEGDSMYDGTDGGLKHGDWAYCRSVPKHYWRDKLHIHKYRIWCFFHNERGIIFKHVESHNPETGELVLSSFNPDKTEYPNFKINIGECSYVCNVVKKLSSL